MSPSYKGINSSCLENKSLRNCWPKKNFTELLARCLPKEWLTPNALETQLAASGQAGVQPSNMAAVSFFFFFGPIFSLWARFLAAVSDIEDGNLANLSNQMLACLLLDGEQH